MALLLLSRHADVASALTRGKAPLLTAIAVTSPILKTTQISKQLQR